jgi:uncharacterized membrane protein
MKLILAIAMLTSMSAFAQRLKTAPVKENAHHVFIKCSTKCGAAQNSNKQVPADTCMKVNLTKGCYCGTQQQISEQTQSCGK